MKITHTYNVVVLGYAYSGYTALCKRLTTRKFCKTQHSTAVEQWELDLSEKYVKLCLIDLIGIKKPQILCINSLIIKNSHYALVMFSVTDCKWQQHIHNWVLYIKAINPCCRIVVVGSKSDLKAVVTQEEVQAYIKTSRYVVKVVFCSAKTGDGVDELLNLPWFTNYKYKKIQIRTSSEHDRSVASNSVSYGTDGAVANDPGEERPKQRKRKSCQ